MQPTFCQAKVTIHFRYCSYSTNFPLVYDGSVLDLVIMHNSSWERDKWGEALPPSTHCIDLKVSFPTSPEFWIDKSTNILTIVLYTLMVSAKLAGKLTSAV